MNNPYNSKLTTRCVHRATCASWIVLLLLALPAAVEAQFAYTINNGAVTITRYYGPGGAVTIPSTILGLPVTTIGEQAFLSCTNVTSVTIPNSVTSISYESFIFCTSLTNVTIANSVTLIGSGAFAYCTSLTEVTIPNSVTVLVGDAFASCSSLSAITVDSLNPAFSSIKGVLFNKSQTALVEFPAGKTGTYTVPNGVAYIGGGAFFHCSTLTDVAIPNSVTLIGGAAFHSCSSLTDVTIPNSVTNLGTSAFSGCTSLTNVTIGNSVTTIDGAFDWCTNLTSVTIPNSVTSIGGSGAFYGCSSLTDVTIPNSVTNVGNSAFGYCTSLTNVTIGNSVTSIGDQAFIYCSCLTRISLPSSVTHIGTSAFGSCSNLTSVTIPNSVTSIQNYTFWGCTSLTNVTIGNGVSSIGDQAFIYCSCLTGVYFMGNAPSLGGWQVFLGDYNATVYYLPGTTGWGAIFGGRPTAPWPPPTIQTSPQTQTAEAGSTVQFRIRAGGDLLGYEWFFNRTNRLGCTDWLLQLGGVQPSHTGAYTVVVTNAAGSVTSAPAMLQVIPPVERRLAPGLTLMGQPGSSLNLDFTAALGPAAQWTTFDHVPLTQASQWYFDLTTPVGPQRFYRAWQTNAGVPPSLSLHMVPALTLTGTIGSSMRVDYINQFGPTDAWLTLATVTLTHTSQLYFDTSSIGQPPRLWRIVPGP